MRILIVCGGTGGHIFPAISLAQELKNRGYRDIVFIVDDNSNAIEIIKNAGFNALSLEVPKMPYGFSIKWFPFMAGLLSSYPKAEDLILTANPDVAIGFGAYVSGPVISVAKSKGTKTLIHEQNATLGRANRLLLDKSDRVCFAFNNSLLGKSNKYILTGNPIRESVLNDLKTLTEREALLRLGLSLNRKTVLVLGGSSGASPINNLFVDMAGGLTEEEKSLIQLLHITGKKDLEFVSMNYRKNRVRHWVVDFYDRMGLLYKAADIITCRAGAATIAEVSLFGLPAIFIPYPGAGSHQRENAAVVANVGGAVILQQQNAAPATLKKLIFGLINDEKKRMDMGSAMRSIARADATEKLADSVEELIRCSLE